MWAVAPGVSKYWWVVPPSNDDPVMVSLERGVPPGAVHASTLAELSSSCTMSRPPEVTRATSTVACWVRDPATAALCSSRLSLASQNTTRKVELSSLAA